MENNYIAHDKPLWKLYMKNNYMAHDKPLWKDAAADGSKYLLSSKNILGTMLDPSDHQR